MHHPRPLVRATVWANYRLGFNAKWPVTTQRRIIEFGARLMQPPRGTAVEHISLAGRPAERVSFGASERPYAVLYLHGGAFVLGTARLYRGTAGQLARSAGAVVYNLDYRLAPEHVYPAALDDAVAAVRELIAVHGHHPSRIAIAGDSAGGGLAVAAARKLADDGMELGALALFSPCVDPSAEDSPPRDFVINSAWGRAGSLAYLGAADPLDPGYAPMHGKLSGLPPMLIHYTPKELLAGQIQRFAARAAEDGADVTVVELPRLWHSAHVLAGTLRDASKAVHDAGIWVRMRMNGSAAAA
jgi:epsilon-lactone hydrolase